MRWIFALAAGFAALLLPYGLALPQAMAEAATPCRGTALSGVVRDSTLALVPGATVALDGGEKVTSGSDGRFRFACVVSGTHRLSAEAEGFARLDMSVKAPHGSPVDLVLKLANVETQVDVAAGGNPANATIAVDGFQGSSALPPKSSIAYIKVNPDQFSAEYREPPFEGGRIEVYTKPGQKAYHGALFATNGNPWENARDPFSTSSAPIGKQRYGFELTGPVRPHVANGACSDFSLTMEHRIIDNFAVVNAVTLDSAGNTVATNANVATPQRLWLATARLDWQLGAKNTFIASYSANVNNLQNVGVGGTALAETGYNSEKYEHMFRLSDITTVSLHLMHEARLSLRWDGEDDAPISSAPQVQVAGAFTGGGATLGAQQLHELNIEADDDGILTTKNHVFKFGTQMMIYGEHQQLTTNFNGSYTFGGGSAPVLDANNNPIAGETETITGVEQYRRAQLGLVGGTPTAFSNVAGTPEVAFTQVRYALFVQDDWNVGHRVHVAWGVRYYIQNDPTVLDSMVPRVGILWAVDKKSTTTIHAHAGMFSGAFGEGDEAEVMREDGTARVTSTVYNPVYGDPLAGATVIHSRREFSRHLSNLTWAAENIGGTHVFPHGWNFSADYYFGRIWNYTRTENINSPLNGEPTGPRPGTPDLNVLEMQASGQGTVNATFMGIEQHTLKHVQMFFGGVRVNLIDDTDDNEFSTPQSAFSNAGEFAHRAGQPEWNVFGNGTFTFPEKIQLSGTFHGGGDSHYNITTGFDNNGGGDFNDRPQYAAPGTPGAVATRYGLLVASGGVGVFPRNQGVMLWTYYLDTNPERAFKLTRDGKAEHQQTLTVNVRSSNVLNHTNVTQVGGVLGSPLFGVPYAADNGRRVEAGVRYSF